jgi:hypothetical protein
MRGWPNVLLAGCFSEATVSVLAGALGRHALGRQSRPAPPESARLIS